MNKTRKYLIYLAVKNQGDWNAIVSDLKNKSILCPSDEELETISNVDAITYLDDEYPQALKNAPQAPLVLFHTSQDDPNAECRITHDFCAPAWVQRKNDRSWDCNAKQAYKDVLDHFSGLPIIIVSRQAEIEIRKGNSISKYREYINRDVNATDFPKAYRIASALSKNLFIFSAKVRGAATLMLTYHLGYGDSEKQAYCLPQPYSLTEDVCNDFIAEGVMPLTRQTLADIKTDEQ